MPPPTTTPSPPPPTTTTTTTTGGRGVVGDDELAIPVNEVRLVGGIGNVVPEGRHDRSAGIHRIRHIRSRCALLTGTTPPRSPPRSSSSSSSSLSSSPTSFDTATTTSASLPPRYRDRSRCRPCIPSGSHSRRTLSRITGTWDKAHVDASSARTRSRPKRVRLIARASAAAASLSMRGGRQQHHGVSITSLKEMKGSVVRVA
jgi:hypothetical protein